MAHRSIGRTSAAALLTLLLLTIGCGSGSTGPSTPPPSPGPAAVASVTLDQSDLSMVPQFTVSLSATTRDAGGSTLTGRTVTWQSSAGTVASVSSSGLVTGLAIGTASVTATSEGKTASATITVRDGAPIGPAGGIVVAAGGNAKLTIPAGALSTTLPISVTPLITPPSPASLVANTAYELGPEGTTFAHPVTLEFKYQAGEIDSLQPLYTISRYTNGKWLSLPGSGAGGASRSVIAATSSFSSYGINISPYLSDVTVTPNNAVVFLGQTRQYAATPMDQFGLPFVDHATKATWTGSAGATVSTNGLVTGVIPGGPYLVHVTESYAIPCPLPRCYVGSYNLGKPNQLDVYADSLYYSRHGQGEAVVGLLPVAAITVAPGVPQIPFGQTLQMSATLKDAGGAALSAQFRTIVWSTSNAAVASVSQAGVVTATSLGTATIAATAEGITGSTLVTVTGSTNPVATVDVTPGIPTIEVGSTVTLTATPRDAGGQPVAGRPVVWVSLAPTIATVSQSGVVTALAPGDAPIGATIDGIQSGTIVTVVLPYPLVLGSPAAGNAHTCLLRSNNTIWCWGGGSDGQLGNGSTTAQQLGPVQASGGAGFTAISAGSNHTCALDAGGRASCWGANPNGQLGDNSTVRKLVPTTVAGGKTFAKIYAGGLTSCGLEASGVPWCWGPGGFVGDGTNQDRLQPVTLMGGLTFAAMSVGDRGSCGLTAGGAAWCWGSVTNGSLGDGTTASSTFPVQVAGGHQFTVIEAGLSGQYCGLTASGEAWCWGSNAWGWLGNGSLSNSTTPVRVSTSLRFTAISGGEGATCALATDQTAWCWGLRGDLGSAVSGLPLYVTTPLAVFGGRQYTEISSGGGHTCGRAADGTWCWGLNSTGQLGTGTTNGGFISWLTPVKVRFP